MPATVRSGEAVFRYRGRFTRLHRRIARPSHLLQRFEGACLGKIESSQNVRMTSALTDVTFNRLCCGARLVRQPRLVLPHSWRCTFIEKKSVPPQLKLMLSRIQTPLLQACSVRGMGRDGSRWQEDNQTDPLIAALTPQEHPNTHLNVR